MSGISTHILDTMRGQPAAGIRVHLYYADEIVGSGVTDEDGRLRALLPQDHTLRAGTYRILFDLAGYFSQGFLNEISISFEVRDAAAYYHVPLLISPFGCTTYRGS